MLGLADRAAPETHRIVFVEHDGRDAAQLAQPSKSFRDDYGPCTINGLTSEISLISVDGMNHDWATAGKLNGRSDPNYSGKPFDVNGTWEAWNFMRTHSLKGTINSKPSLNVLTTGKGAVDLSPVGPSYDKGTQVTLTAKPQAGWAFDSWSGTGASGNTNPLTITFDTTRTITANFTRLPNSDLEVNGDFGSGSDGWTFNTWNGSSATGSVVNGEYQILIANVGTSNSDIQLIQNGILLENGTSYQVQFDAYAASDRTLEANVEQDVSPWATYLDSLRTFNLTTTKTTYSYTFNMAAATDSNGRISFNAGASTETVFLDNISIKALSAGIRPHGGTSMGALRWSADVLLLSGVKSGRVQIVDSRGQSKFVEVTGGRAYTGRLPTGLYQARVVGANSVGFQHFIVLR